MLKKVILVGALSFVAMAALATPVQSTQRQTCHSTILVDSNWSDYNISFNAKNMHGEIIQSLGTYKAHRGLIVHAYYPCQDQDIIIEATPAHSGHFSSDESFVSQDPYSMNRNISAAFSGNFIPASAKKVN